MSVAQIYQNDNKIRRTRMRDPEGKSSLNFLIIELGQTTKGSSILLCNEGNNN